MRAISDTLNADFTSNKVQLFVGDSVDFTDSSLGNHISWTWTFEGGIPEFSTERNPTVAYSYSGSYYVKLVVANNINNKDSIVKDIYITVNDTANTASIKLNNSDLKFTVYPNPANGIISVNYTAANSQQLKLQVLNAIGQCIYSQSYSCFTGSLSESIDLSKEAKGVYLVQLIEANHTFTQKVVFH